MTYSTKKSQKLFARAQKSLVGGMASGSHKGSWMSYPIFMDHGEGSKVYDVDGNSYIDYLCAFGPLILGYNPKAVVEAVALQLQRATLTASPSESLITLCEKLISVIPCAEKVSAFMSSGSEANMHAIRVARAYTGKVKIIKFEGGYHGSLDEEKVSVSGESEACLGPRNDPFKQRHINGQKEPLDVIIAQFNDLNHVEQILRRHGNEIACIILEPIMANCEPVFPQDGFLKGLRELATKFDVILIFDEVITGFRLRLGGAQEYFGIKPDIATLGKAMAGGYPISAVVGREDVLTTATIAAGTFNGNALCVAAALATLGELEKPGFYEKLETISKVITCGINNLGKKYGIKTYAEAIGGFWTIALGTDTPLKDYRDHFNKVDKQLYSKVVQRCLENGIRLNPWRGRNYISAAATAEDVEYTLRVIDEIFMSIEAGTL